MTRELDRIVNTALELAEDQGWEKVRLYRVAERMEMPLEGLLAHIREKEDLVDAWLDRADHAMLQAADSAMVAAMPTVERLEYLVLVWLRTLAPHRRVTAQMIRGKLEAGHIHVQIPAVLRISRTVQWLREAGHRDAPGFYRGLEETVLTTIFVSTFVHWLRDESPDQERTRRRLVLALRAAARLSRWVPGFRAHHHAVSGALPAPTVVERPSASRVEARS